MAALGEKVAELDRAAAQRKAKLDENSAFLQFNWKADVVESWIGRPGFPGSGWAGLLQEPAGSSVDRGERLPTLKPPHLLLQVRRRTA